MAIMRMKSRLSASSPAPPPSPIPTTKAHRSATDPIFSDYLDKSKNNNLSDLNLPEYVNRLIIADVDYKLLKSRDGESIHGMVRSAVKFGVFRITGHGILAEELQSTFEEVDSGFGFLTQRWRRDGDREEFVWSRSAVAIAERRIDVARDEEFQRFSQKMENVASKLEAIAEEVAQIIATNGSKHSRTKIKQSETKLSLYRHNQPTLQAQTPRSTDGSRLESCKYALSLHLPAEQCGFCLLSERGPLAFQTGSDAVVVTLGEQFEEWSLGEFKSTFGEINIEPDPQVSSQASFSIELRCSPPSLNHAAERIDNKICITDQILIVVIVSLLYKMFALMFS